MKRRNFLKNKKGSIPITILVIGVLAICALAIFSFYSANRIFKNTLNSLDVLEEISIEKEKISLYGELGFTQEEIKEIFNIKTDPYTQERYITTETMERTLLVRYNLPK